MERLGQYRILRYKLKSKGHRQQQVVSPPPSAMGGKTPARPLKRDRNSMSLTGTVDAQSLAA